MDRAGYQRNRVPAQSINLSVTRLFTSLYLWFPHLSNQRVGLVNFPGLFQLEHSIILLSLCSDK